MLVQIDSVSIPNLIAGRYEVLRRLGSGSAGLVLECRDTEVGSTKVALKLFPKEVVKDRRTMGRIQRELLLAFKVEHHNVVRFYDTIRDGEWFGYTMEHVRGTSLETMLREKVAFNADTVVRILAQVCAGLDAIHSVGIVHRDLKPGNILLTDDGVAKIVDFGLAKEVNDDFDGALGGVEIGDSMIARRITEVGDTPGTPDFISPEYIQHGTCDERSDLYAVGVIGFELLTGRSIFPDRHLPTLLQRKVNEDAPPVTSLNPRCPYNVEAVIMTALRRDPDERYQSARDMRDELLRLRSTLVTSSGSFDAPIMRLKSAHPQMGESPESRSAPAPKHDFGEILTSIFYTLIAVLILVSISAAGIYLLVTRDQGALRVIQETLQRWL